MRWLVQCQRSFPQASVCLVKLPYQEIQKKLTSTLMCTFIVATVIILFPMIGHGVSAKGGGQTNCCKSSSRRSHDLGQFRPQHLPSWKHSDQLTYQHHHWHGHACLSQLILVCVILVNIRIKSYWIKSTKSFWRRCPWHALARMTEKGLLLGAIWTAKQRFP